MKNFLAIDPGASGGFAAIRPENEKQPRTQAMPKTEGDIIALFELVTDGETEVYMEAVSGFIGKPQPGSRMFNFGAGYGFLKGVIMAKQLPLHLIRPQKWQTALGLGSSGGMDKTKWKNKLKSEAQRLYPRNKITLQTADALLILRYALLESGNRDTNHDAVAQFPNLSCARV